MRVRQHERHRRQVEPQRRRARHGRPDRGREQPASAPTSSPRRSSASGSPRTTFKKLQSDARAGRGARPRARRRGRRGDEGVGARARRDPLHPHVPAAHRPHRREARFLLRARRRRRRARRVLRQGADPGRARRLLVPDRRRPRHLRGPRLHRLGPDQPGLHPREPERRAALHPDRVRVVDRRGARRQDPAAALDGRALELGDPGAAAARRRASPSASSPPSGPSRSTS